MAPVTAPRRGRAPDELVNAALSDLFDRVHDTRDAPPQLGPSIAAMQLAGECDDVAGYVAGLLDLGAAVVANLAVVRASEET